MRLWEPGDRAAAFFFCCAAALCFLMPSSQSIWIDEAQTYVYVERPNLRDFARHLVTDQKSETLMPAGMFGAWLGGKLLGTQEWQLRAPNILWMLIGVGAFASIGQLWRAPWAPLLFATQPFVWFYANEARPYGLLIGCGAVIAAVLAWIVEKRTFSRTQLLILTIASGLMIATNLFGVLTAGIVVVFVLFGIWRGWWRVPARSTLIIACSAVWWPMWGVYYLHALAKGSGGARLWSVNVHNVGFAAYEFLGFAGFGPGRDELRVLARSARAATGIPAGEILAIAFLAVIYAWILVRFLRSSHGALVRATAWLFIGVLLFVWVATCGLALITKFPFWGRHLAAVFPFTVALLVLALRGTPEKTQLSQLALTYLLIATTLTSSLLLRFHPRHYKDDYRSAAALAKAAIARGESVWWAAEGAAAAYYGLSISSDAGPGKGTYLVNPDDATLANAGIPDLIVLSKPDVHDETGGITNFIRSQNFRLDRQLKAFEVWVRSNETAKRPEEL